MVSPESIQVRVIYALPDRRHQVTLRIREGATVREALRLSGLQQRFSEIAEAPKCAVFSRIVAADYVLRDGDRIEILRPLLVDPKDNRRKAAQSLRGGFNRR
jgi:putative ubiquitin-RnfH superfamily antitoxin RatB of RatAB toxin-antitoxin module